MTKIRLALIQYRNTIAKRRMYDSHTQYCIERVLEAMKEE